MELTVTIFIITDPTIKVKYILDYPTAVLVGT